MTVLLRKSTFQVLLLLAVGFGVVVFSSSGRGKQTQSKPERTTSNQRVQAGASGDVVRLSAPAKPASGAGAGRGTPASYDDAAISNIQLQTDLEWNFGGRLQRGWALYAPLIGYLIGADPDATTTQFAMKLSVWQGANDLESTGTLDSDTWSLMVSRFQSRRTIRPNAGPIQLVTIPTSDCYDVTRAEELRSVERDTFAAYKRMVAAAASDSSLGLQVDGNGQLSLNEKLLKIVSAYRSREYQERLRQQSPNSGRAGLAINSPHFTGRALDLYVGGEPVNTKDANRALQTQGAVYRWLVKNAARFGFQPYFYEPWHWEYVGVRSPSSK